MDQKLLLFVMKEQQDEIKLKIENTIDRQVQQLFKEFVKSKLVKIIVGMRRSGKSTLALNTLSLNSFVYFNFDDERLVGLTSQDLNLVYECMLMINPQAGYFIFDEIQNIENWELFINRLQRKKINVIITGSNGRLLSKEIASNLTGRQLSLQLYPFTFLEYLKLKQISYTGFLSTEKIATIKNSALFYLMNGGMPEVLQGEDVGPYMRELFDKVIHRDIVERFGVKNIKLQKELGVYLMNTSGSIQSLERLKNSLKFSSINSVKSYLENLLCAYLVWDLPAYSYKIREKTTLPKKIYASDVGFLTALNLGISNQLGFRLETLVFLELLARGEEIYYYKKEGVDIDFVIVREKKIQEFIQVSYQITHETTSIREVSNLIKAATNIYKINLKPQLRLITWNEENLIKQNNFKIEVVPFWKWALNLNSYEKL